MPPPPPPPISRATRSSHGLACPPPPPPISKATRSSRIFTTSSADYTLKRDCNKIVPSISHNIAPGTGHPKRPVVEAPVKDLVFGLSLLIPFHSFLEHLAPALPERARFCSISSREKTDCRFNLHIYPSLAYCQKASRSSLSCVCQSSTSRLPRTCFASTSERKISLEGHGCSMQGLTKEGRVEQYRTMPFLRVLSEL